MKVKRATLARLPLTSGQAWAAGGWGDRGRLVEGGGGGALTAHLSAEVAKRCTLCSLASPPEIVN